MFTSFLHSELLKTSCKIFQRYYPGIFMFAAMQNHHRLSIFDSVLTVLIWYILDDNFRIYINRPDGDYINAISLPVSTNLLTNYYNIFATHIK